jgi:hypothetical protein
MVVIVADRCEIHFLICVEQRARVARPVGAIEVLLALEPVKARAPLDLSRRIHAGQICFLARFESTYGGVGRTDAILASAAAHQRLLRIHPFLDGNGRVSRLMSHCLLLDALDTGGIWSVSRGLARNVDAYKAHLAACDLPRRNDPDGRGNLSEETLAAFTRFFLEICLDQVTFMEGLVQPDHLRTRILLWAEEQTRLDRLPARPERSSRRRYIAANCRAVMSGKSWA